jgi:hypothetical protein
MFLAIVIYIVMLIFCAALFIASCETILRRRLNQQFFHLVVTAYRLQFPFVRKALEDLDVPVNYSGFRMQLKTDFLACIYLLRNAKGFSAKERLCLWELRKYFYVVFLVLIIAHNLRLNERAAFVKLTKILEYFANVLGELDTVPHDPFSLT